MEETRRLEAEEQSAAIVIQSRVRGRLSRLKFERAEAETQAALGDTSWLKCDIKTWLTERDEGDIVDKFKEIGLNTLQELVRNPRYGHTI